MTDTIAGFVTLNGVPTQARVTLINSTSNTVVSSVLSNPSTGAWSFPGLPAGTYEILIVKSGYAAQCDGPWTIDGIPGGGGWSPFFLASPPALWLDTTSSVTDAGGGACSQWNDISGNSYHVTQGTASKQPLITNNELNNLRVLTFDGGDALLIPSGALSLYNNVSSGWIFSVFKNDITDASAVSRPLAYFSIGGGSNARLALWSGMSTSSGGTSSGQNKLGIGARRLDSDSVYAVQSAVERSQTWVMALAAVDYVGRTIRLYVDGQLDVQATNQFTASGNTSATNSNSARVGANSAENLFLNGKQAALLCGTTIPSATEIDKIFGWAAHEHGLTANLPSNHPYKESPP